jgi:hypothetical protein
VLPQLKPRRRHSRSSSTDRLNNLAQSVAERIRTELGLDHDHDQDAVIADLGEIAQTIVRRLDSACRSPPRASRRPVTCSTSFPDVRRVPRICGHRSARTTAYPDSA